MKLLIAVDGSVYTPRVLQFVVAHPELLGAVPELSLITVVPQVAPHAARHLPQQVLAQYYDEEAEAVLAPARELLLRAGLAPTSQRCQGNPAATIAAQATAGGFDVLLMGSRGHSAVGNLVLGSVVTGVLALCRTPVLVVR